MPLGSTARRVITLSSSYTGLAQTDRMGSKRQTYNIGQRRLGLPFAERKKGLRSDGDSASMRCAIIHTRTRGRIHRIRAGRSERLARCSSCGI